VLWKLTVRLGAGDVIVWGWEKVNQLGNHNPLLKPFVVMKNAKDIACGICMTVVLTDSEVILYGCSSKSS